MFDWFSEKTSADKPKEEKLIEEYIDPAPLIGFFKSETGITFEQHQSIIIRKLASFCRQRNISSFRECLCQLDDDATLKQEMINYLTTNESYFYREFAQIRKLVSLAASRPQPFSILCAPCATGEEPYSIAMAMLESGIPENGFHITGIDINTDALEKAREATYSARSIRDVPPEIVQKYFACEKDRYVLNRSVCNRVTLKQINIFDHTFPSLGKFDFVFSRNMLIYFDKETKLKAQSILESMRKDDSIPVFFGHADLF